MIGTPKKVISWLLEKNQNTKYEIKQYKKKRTPRQNNYYWELIGKLAEKLRISQDELHFELIKKSCPFVEIMIPAESNLKPLGKYIEKLKTIQSDNKMFDIIRVYAGSSELNTKEMNILVDNLIEECHLQDIETLTPEEIEKMRSLEVI